MSFVHWCGCLSREYVVCTVLELVCDSQAAGQVICHTKLIKSAVEEISNPCTMSCHLSLLC